MQDSYKQLSINHEQLQATHDHLTDRCTEATLELSKVRQELAESKLDLDTSKFLRQVCQPNRPLQTVHLNHLTQNCCVGLQELEVSKEEEVLHFNQAVYDLEGATARTEAASHAQIKQLEQQVAELRDIIDSSMHTKRASTLKLETAMNALNLSKGDAKQFIQVHALTRNLFHCLADASAGTNVLLD